MTDIFALSDQAVDRLAALVPTEATLIGVAGHDERWPDLSPDGVAAEQAMWAELGRQARACPTPDDRTVSAQRALVDFCDTQLAVHEAGIPFQDLNNIASPHQNLRFVFGSMNDSTEADWEAIITRVETVQQPLEGYRQTLAEGLGRGLKVSRRQVEAVAQQGRSASGDGSSFNDLRRRLADAGLADHPLADRLDRAIDGAKAAFADFNRFLIDDYLPRASEVDGVGEEHYLLAARTFLGTDIDPAETYRWGWGEVERLWAEMQTACAAIDSDAAVAEVFDRLQTDPAYAAAGEAEFIEAMTARQHQALAALDGTHFDVPAEIRNISVQVEPPGGSLGAHYVPPSEDFSRPGAVWYPVAGQEHFPLFQEVTTAYHEGFPGHHLQCGIQVAEAENLSRFQRLVIWYPGSGEGWALYAEHLMGELGYLERPEYVVGLLSAQLLRACRVAIDIGVHLDLAIPDDVSFHPGERWSYELAHELLTNRALITDEVATSEVIRYFGWPGQAISYKLGERAILDLRAEAEAEAGAQFDPKAFHARVLGIGSVGLDHLRDHVSAARS